MPKCGSHTVVFYASILVSSSQTSIYVHWFVSTKEDVADFVIYVRDGSNKLQYSSDISYHMRSITVPIEEEFKTSLRSGGTHQICIQAKSSNGAPRKWHPSQCQTVPSDFDSWAKKLVVDKRKIIKKKPRRGWFHNSVMGLVSDSILITLCIFLGVCFKITDGL